jgi:ParB-like chromosome segregation protein Spo0J
MSLTARRLSRLHPLTCQRLLTEPDSLAAAIAERGVIVPPVGHPMPLPGNVTVSLRMLFERHDKTPR